jgi:hypothetical protein
MIYYKLIMLIYILERRPPLTPRTMPSIENEFCVAFISHSPDDAAGVRTLLAAKILLAMDPGNSNGKVHQRTISTKSII